MESTTDLDEALARQLMLEDQEAQQARRHATGASWPRQDVGPGAGQGVPYQARQQQQQQHGGGGVPPEEARTDLQELQRTMGQIAESGKRTFSSIVSRVKAKINEYEQSRCVSPPSLLGALSPGRATLLPFPNLPCLPLPSPLLHRFPP